MEQSLQSLCANGYIIDMKFPIPIELWLNNVGEILMHNRSVTSGADIHVNKSCIQVAVDTDKNEYLCVML